MQYEHYDMTPPNEGQTTDLSVLLPAAFAGDQDAWDQLVRVWTPELIGFLLSKGVHPDDIEDVIQEYWIVVQRNCSKIDCNRPGSNPRAILFHFAGFAVSSHRRSEAMRNGAGRTDDVPPDGVKIDRAAMDKAMAELERDNPLQYQIVVMAANGYTLQEIANELGISIGSVAGHVRRGRSRLRKAVGLESNHTTFDHNRMVLTQKHVRDFASHLLLSS